VAHPKRVLVSRCQPSNARKEEMMRLRIMLTALALVAAAVANGGYGWGP
jgi:hypothetical protein